MILKKIFGEENLQKQAKRKSEKFLKKKGIRINKSLPFIEDPSELKPQSAKSVATRCVVLGYIIGISYDQSGSTLKSLLDDYGMYDFTSDAEKKLLAKKKYTKQDKINVSWLPECVQSLAWGLNLANIDHFNHCDDDLAEKIPCKKDPSPFIDSAKLRPYEEIFFQSDLLYRMHWAARDDRLNGRKEILNESLISERRKAMDWMLGVEDDWDEVPMDT